VSYVLSVSPAAKAQLLSHPEPLRSFIEASLEQLALSPSSVTARSAISGRRAKFEPDPSTAIWVVITFVFGSDEQTLFVEHIATEFGG
jgi:hypothetical protein